jgi:hypothetical protein
MSNVKSDTADLYDSIFSKQEFDDAYRKCLESEVYVRNERKLPANQSIFGWLLADEEKTGQVCEKLKTILEEKHIR